MALGSQQFICLESLHSVGLGSGVRRHSGESMGVSAGLQSLEDSKVSVKLLWVLDLVPVNV